MVLGGICRVCQNTNRVPLKYHSLEESPDGKKTCNKCTRSLELNEFYKDRTKKYGVNSICKQCSKEFDFSRREYKSALNKRIYYENQEKSIARVIKYNKENRATINIKQKEYCKRKSLTNPIFKLSKNIRTLISVYIAKKGFIKTKRTVDILGCDFDQLNNHLIQTAVKNYGVFRTDLSYEIDHIIPIATAKTEEDVIRLNHYSNLQYLTKEHNREKGDKLDWILPLNNRD